MEPTITFEGVGLHLPPAAKGVKYAFKGGALVLHFSGFTGDIVLRAGALVSQKAFAYCV